jgi:hypothetical protein
MYPTGYPAGSGFHTLNEWVVPIRIGTLPTTPLIDMRRKFSFPAPFCVVCSGQWHLNLLHDLAVHNID